MVEFTVTIKGRCMVEAGRAMAEMRDGLCTSAQLMLELHDLQDSGTTAKAEVVTKQEG